MANFTKKIVTLLLATVALTQSDGNPHNWGRLRRCDYDYEKPCELCEGMGGIAWSDKPEDITYTKCEPVATAEQMKDDVQAQEYPRFPLVFSNTGFYEVLISVKKNFLCIGGFPGADSTGDHCYQPQQGGFYYNWNDYELMMDYQEIKGTVFNSSAQIYHKRENMWILNNLGLGVKQCICTQPGKTFNIPIYPIMPDFMKLDSRLIGREKVWIEFINEDRIVDHWIKGPHHIWKDVETQQILRMWQPWNGLEVLDYKTWQDTIIVKGLEFPPHQCNKKWDRFTIKCGENGEPL